MTVKELKELLEGIDENKKVIFEKTNATSQYDGWQVPVMEKVETFTERKNVVVLG